MEATLCVLHAGSDLTSRVRAAGVPVIELNGGGTGDLRRATALRQLASRHDVVHASLPGASAFAASPPRALVAPPWSCPNVAPTTTGRSFRW